MSGIMEDEVVQLLRGWGAWAGRDPMRLGYDRMNLLGRMKGSTVRSVSIDETEALAVDHAVSQLALIDKFRFDVAGYAFILNLPDAKISRILKRGQTSVRTARHCVVAYVMGQLPASIDAVKKTLDARA